MLGCVAATDMIRCEAERLTFPHRYLSMGHFQADAEEYGCGRGSPKYDCDWGKAE